ncbi:hypothetical protein AVEN_25987-1 [Araneus ventricosus]|uniref:Uncharacterized protein n=1 Tax=Araneus ventricosus TaxID=182803 RepID=A0A4Y2TR96_ARAVE|nr:hypothetical protein AVEN_25987-1 [Araneus ventricosus]
MRKRAIKISLHIQYGIWRRQMKLCQEKLARNRCAPWTPGLPLMLLEGLMSRRLIHKLWEELEFENSVSRRPVSSQPRFITLAEDRFLALSIRRRKTTTVVLNAYNHEYAHARYLCELDETYFDYSVT